MMPKRIGSVLIFSATLAGAAEEEWSVVCYTAEAPPPTPSLESLPLRESVSQYGITWTFAAPARVGRFVTGDWYVVGPVTIVAIEPRPLWGNEVTDPINQMEIREDRYAGRQARNGSSLNPPSRGGRAGFDSRAPSGRYDPDRFTPLPIAMKPGDALVSTISRPSAEFTKFSGQHADPLRAAAVLCCVAEPLPPDAFRPSYTDSANSPLRLSRNLRRDRLLALPRPALPRGGPPANLEGYARKFQRPWLDLSDFGFTAPIENLPHYGQNMVQDEGEATLLLLMDYPPEQKEPLLIGLVQVGIDFHGVARGGFSWPAHGGLYSGRKWPIVFAGLMLDDPALFQPQKKIAGLRFAEDDQTAFGPVTYRGATYERSFSGARAIFMGHSPYLWNSPGHFEKGWGLIDVLPPAEWPKRSDGGKILASEGYRRANTSAAWVAQALAARLLHAEEAWGHDAFFAYVDRWMTEDDMPLNQAMKEAGWVDYTGTKAGDFGRQSHITGSGSAWVREMWKTWRNQIPPGPDGARTPPAETTWK